MNISDIRDISKIGFGILSAEKIRKMSVCKIDSPKMSGPNTVYDDRMGVKDINERCPTCDLKKECWGHFGHIELNEPILHPMLIKQAVSFLKCICKNCHKLLITRDQVELFGFLKSTNEKRFLKILKKIDKKDICAHCLSPQPKILFKDTNIIKEYKQKGYGEKTSIVMSTEEIKEIFEGLSDSDVELLGFDSERTHPKNLIITVLPVMPPCSRPFVKADGNTSDDDLTFQYIEIIKINNQLSKPENKNDKRIQSLKFRISTLFNNSKGKAKHPTDSRPFKALKDRLSGKGGRIRNNCMGKRTNFSARTVIGAEPTLKMNEYAIPYEVATIHSKPETVTFYNIDWLTKLVNEGKANIITTTKPDGTQINLTVPYVLNKAGTKLINGDYIIRNGKKNNIPMTNKNNVALSKIENKILVITGREKIGEHDVIVRDKKVIETIPPSKRNIKIKIGDIVHRQLQKGDIILVNRQPTLHRGSMLGMEAVPMPYKTFRFNLACTKSFNADFDGDEMNTHAPQSYEAEAELRFIANSKYNIISAQESKPIVVITQDSLIACFLMTRKNFSLSRNQFNHISMKGELYNKKPLFNLEKLQDIKYVFNKFGKEKEILNGKGLFSLLLPNNLFYEKKNNANPDEPIVKIYKGVLYEGTLDKNILGSVHNSLIHVIHKEYGPEITSNFIDNILFIGNEWLMLHGFSVGLEDCMIKSDSSIDAIKSTLTQCYTKAQGIEESTHNEGIKEIRITGALSQAKDIGMKIAKESMSKNNNFLTTVISGAKGDFFNIAQITGLLGQQNLEGHRVEPKMNNKKRTLPHYPLDEKISKERDYESKGFIRHSFIRGLSPEEFFFHAMAGREGVIDTAMGTAKSGYTQRKIIKLCEDVKINEDYTVRDITDKIYQFSYGNNFDAMKTVKVNNVQTCCDIERLANKINFSFEEGILNENKNENEPDITLTEITKSDFTVKKKNLIQKLQREHPGITIDPNWTEEELKERLQAINVSSDEEKSESDDESETEEEEEETEEYYEEEEEENNDEIDDEFIDDDSVASEPDYDE